jgi:hypothetical protein
MRTARRVIVLLLVSCAGGVLLAQQTGAQSASEGSVDSSVTVTGRDDAVLPIPEPAGSDEELVLPPLDTTPTDAPPVGPFAPPVAAISPPPPPDLGDLGGPRSQ